MEKFILFFPVIIGVILDVIGGFLYFKRKKFGIHVIGTVTGIAKSQTKYAGVKVTTEAPIVKYDITDQTYTAPSANISRILCADAPKGADMRYIFLQPSAMLGR